MQGGFSDLTEDCSGKIDRGRALPLGHSLTQVETQPLHNFSIFAPVELIHLEIRDAIAAEVIALYSLDPQQHRTGDVWHIALVKLPDTFTYTWRLGAVDAPPVGDPYAKLLAGEHNWANPKLANPKLPLMTFALVEPQKAFSWEEDRFPQIPWSQTVLYEVHVRGFTKHSSSLCRAAGSLGAFREKLPYLKWLGITSLELMPIAEFLETEYDRNNPLDGNRLCNFWGYSSLNFFSPMRAFAEPATSTKAQVELKELVRAAHALDMEVLLDVVYNHTGEGNEAGPSFSFKALASSRYYMMSDTAFQNHTGCGNTLNANDSVVAELIVSSLRHFVCEYHIDGFRFDLATLLMRMPNNEIHELSHVLGAIVQDPILSKVKLIAEPWDPSGVYRVGNFPGGTRFSEWNDRFRDDVRRFINFGTGKGAFGTRLGGSQDLFKEKTPLNSINFITCHDGFCLADLVSYSQKHNEANGEENRDGNNNNNSANCGVEGPSIDPMVCALRTKQMKNFLLALLLSQGVPMILSGDEYGHTKGGNNNSWSQDTDLNWFHWETAGKSILPHFTRHLIELRKKFFSLSTHFLTEQLVTWHGKVPNQPRWDHEDGCIALTLRHSAGEIFLAFNAHANDTTITLPLPIDEGQWALSVNTASNHPEDFFELGSEVPIPAKLLNLKGQSAVLLLSVVGKVHEKNQKAN